MSSSEIASIPAYGDVRELDAGVKGDRRENRHLGCGVGAVHVVGRVGLGEPATLRLGERLAVRRAALHLGEDEVGRAVDDAEDPVHVRDDQRLAQHLDHRDRSAHAGLEPQLHTGARRGGEELGAPSGNELLVGGHHALTAAEQLRDICARRLDAAHHLGDDRDRVVLDDRGEVGRQDTFRGRKAAVLLDVTHERLDHAEPVAGRPFDVICGFDEKPVDRRAHGAVPEQRDRNVNRRHAPP